MGALSGRVPECNPGIGGDERKRKSRCVRKAEKSGVTIEEAHDIAFADEYYEQLKDVFAKQGLVPTYDVERVRALVRHMEPSGNVLLLRARDPEGKCIATGIFPGFNK